MILNKNPQGNSKHVYYSKRDYYLCSLKNFDHLKKWDFKNHSV